MLRESARAQTKTDALRHVDAQQELSGMAAKLKHTEDMLAQV